MSRVSVKVTVLFAVLFLGRPASVAVGQGLIAPSFVPEYTYATEGCGYRIEPADFNKDGKPDLAVTTACVDAVDVFWGDGTGDFPSKTRLAVGGNPVELSTQDFNGDGLPDVAAECQYPENVYVYLNNGAGGFTGPHISPVGHTPVRLVAADFNGDGKLDIATADGWARDVMIALGDGAGNFTISNSFHVSGLGHLAVGDLNKDGKPDIVTANDDYNGVPEPVPTSHSLSIAVFYGVGDGHFASGQYMDLGGRPVKPAVADINSDGNLDIATFASNELVLLIGNGAGQFTEVRSPLGAGWDWPGDRVVRAADLNGDGHLDLVLVGSSVAYMLGDGNGGFTLPVNILTDTPYAYDVNVVDLNLDGSPDLIARYFSGAVGVLLNSTLSPTCKPMALSLPRDIQVVASDISGVVVEYPPTVGSDTRSCTISSGSTFPIGSTAVTCTVTNACDLSLSKTFHVTVIDEPPVLSLPGGAYGTATDSSGAVVNFSTSATDTLSGDLPVSCGPASGSAFPVGLTTVTCSATDGAGHTSMGSFKVFVFGGCVGCTLPALGAAHSFNTRPGTTGILTAEFNHDGKPDIAVVDADGMGIMLGDGAGNFGPPNWFGYQGGKKISPVAADVNNDGNLDLGFAIEFQNARFYHGDGAGGFTGGYTEGLFPDGMLYSLEAADLNNDGWVDVLQGFESLGSGWGNVAFNRGGSFLDESYLNPEGQPNYVIGLAIADFNRDGKPDVALTSFYSGAVMLGDGAGNFNATYTFLSGGAGDLAAGDLNGDGRPDLISNNSVHLGDGVGGFTPIMSPAEYQGNFRLGDMNLDGRLDLVLPNTDGVRIWLGDGVGGFGAPTYLDTPIQLAADSNPVAPRSSMAMVLGDFNGDGRPDIAALGDGAINVRLNTTAPTPGAPAVALTTTGPGSTTTTPESSLTFSNVTVAGTTTVEPDQTAAANYSLSNNLGSYEIETTATYSTTGYYAPGTTTVADPTKGIRVSFKVPSVTTEAAFNELVVTHGEDTNGDGVLEMVPYNGTSDPLKITYHDFATRTVWVYVPHLSPFVVVKGAADQIADLVALVKTYNLKQGISNSFDAKLENAQKALAAAKGMDRPTACNQMAAFISEAQAQSGKALTAAQAARLVGAAKGVRLLLGCQ